MEYGVRSAERGIGKSKATGTLRCLYQCQRKQNPAGEEMYHIVGFSGFFGGLKS